MTEWQVDIFIEELTFMIHSAIHVDVCTIGAKAFPGKERINILSTCWLYKQHYTVRSNWSEQTYYCRLFNHTGLCELAYLYSSESLQSSACVCKERDRTHNFFLLRIGQSYRKHVL